MKVVIPEDIKDITLGQFQKFVALDKVEDITDKQVNKEKLKIFIGLTDDEIKGMSKNDFDELVKLIDEALNKPAKFEKTFKIKDTTFGFHPNLDQMTSGEHGDLSDYNDGPENFHRLMAILFRPITGKDLSGNYKIAAYNGTDIWCEVMKQTPLNIVNGALVFFLNLSKELRICIQESSKVAELRKGEKHQIFGLSGAGTHPLPQ